jgi:translation initiation factor 2B subunit (eIF-2B alpha/beta/delta family)
MKIAFLVETAPEQTEIIKEKLERFDYANIPTSSAEEIDQAGKQAGQVMICFTESKIAYSFLKSNRWPFKTLNVLFLKGKPKITEDAAKKIKEVNLDLVIVNDENSFKELVTRFENSGNDIDELEFAFKG